MNPKPKKPVVGIVMGSDSDFPIMEETVKALKSFDIPHEVRVISAHRAPAQVMEYARTAQKRGLKVIIAGAGGAPPRRDDVARHRGPDRIEPAPWDRRAPLHRPDAWRGPGSHHGGRQSWRQERCNIFCTNIKQF